MRSTIRVDDRPAFAVGNGLASSWADGPTTICLSQVQIRQTRVGDDNAKDIYVQAFRFRSQNISTTHWRSISCDGDAPGFWPRRYLFYHGACRLAGRVADGKACDQRAAWRVDEEVSLRSFAAARFACVSAWNIGSDSVLMQL